jgi:hypothetical protein
MATNGSFATVQRLRMVCILSALLTIAMTTFAAAGGSTPQNSGAAPPASADKPLPKPMAKPLWSDLKPQQQQALAPLAAEWNTMEIFHKRKWLEIGNKFSTMKTDEQLRLQERMRDWAKLTPEQRRVARQSFARAKKLDPDQKSAQWQQYQQLPEEQKKKLAADGANKKHVANLPSAHSKNKTLPPIKATPKPVLEKSVTPQAAQHAAIQPSAPPADK